MDPRAYWVGFNLVKGIGAVRLKSLLDYFGNLEIAWQAPADALTATGLPARSLENLLQVRKQVNLEQVWQQFQQRGIQIYTWDDPEYPRRLKEIDQPPPVLYLRGTYLPQDDLAVAVVGTRNVTVYGRQVANELAAFLAQHGITVVSGLARGVDGIAHDSALRAGGRTLAVLGSGVDRVYPPEHQHLAERVIAQGALISDYAPGTPPDAANFPPRNRIISGLARATVVVEAGEESGALITAEFANDQGREVLAVPGGIYAPQSKGTNRLIQQGAQPLLKMTDLLDSLGLITASGKVIQQPTLLLDETESRLMRVVSKEPLHIDEICVLSGLSIDKVSATLTVLELKGLVRQVGAMNYLSLREPKAEYE